MSVRVCVCMYEGTMRGDGILGGRNALNGKHYFGSLCGHTILGK